MTPFVPRFVFLSLGSFLALFTLLVGRAMTMAQNDPAVEKFSAALVDESVLFMWRFWKGGSLQYYSDSCQMKILMFRSFMSEP